MPPRRAVPVRAPDAPAEAICRRAGCLACRAFALAEPHAYRVLIRNRTTAITDTTIEDLPGGAAFGLLAGAIEACLASGAAPVADPLRTATNTWTALHGIATLRHAVPTCPWPDRAALVGEALVGLVELGRGEADATPGRAAAERKVPVSPPAAGCSTAPCPTMTSARAVAPSDAMAAIRQETCLGTAPGQRRGVARTA